MNRNLLSVMVAAVLVLSACSSQKKMESDDDFSVDANEGQSPAASSAPSDDLSLDTPAAPTAAAAKKAPPAAAGDSDSALENELNSLDAAPAKTADAPSAKPASPSGDELTLDDPKPQAPAPKPPVAPTAQAAAAPVPEEIPPPQEVALSSETSAANPPAAAPAPAPVAASDGPAATINSVQYKANSNGGTIAIGSTQPLSYTTRLNSTTNQFIVEVQNSLIPKKLKRTLNTKDMASSIGSVDIYQKDGSNVSRFVVQLRPGASEPIVQPEGNSLLIIGGGNVGTAPVATTSEMGPAPQEKANSETSAPQEVAMGSAGSDNSAVDENQPSAAGGPKQPALSDRTKKLNASNEVVDLASEGLLSYDNLEDFLMTNNKFYGKKISIAIDDMDIREAIKFIAQESNTNIIMDDSVSGRVNLGLRDVPWDQALVLILKSKKLIYKRQGNVIRIARLEDIKKDEEDAIALKESRKVKEALVVKRFFIGYAPIDDLAQKIKDYIAITDVKNPKAVVDPTSSQGKVISDKRTNSLIITETAENIKRIESLLSVLDTQPPQILIEGKVVEAQENFSRGMGITWSSTGNATSANSGRFTITPTTSGPPVLASEFTWGQVDFLGSLTARLALGESEQKVKVLSSPRITVLSSESATITSTSSISVDKGTTTTGGATTAIKETQNVGITLNVTPQASNEGTVTLTLNITRSFQGQNSQTFARSAQTKVIVKSGQTSVIGGIYESSNTDISSGVPGLRSVPVIGSLFQGNTTTKDKSELLIFVTPTILKNIRGEENKQSFIK